MKLNKYGIKKNIGIGKNIGVRKNNIGIGKNNIGIGKYINLNLFLNILYGILFIGFIYFIYYYIFNKLHFEWDVELISDPNTLEPIPIYVPVFNIVDIPILTKSPIILPRNILFVSTSLSGKGIIELIDW